VSLGAGPARSSTLATIRLVGGTEMFLSWVGSAGFPTGRDGFSFFLLAMGTALPEKLASSLWPLHYLRIPELLAPGAVKMFLFSVPLSQDLPSFISFHDLKPVSIILEFQRCASRLGVVQRLMDQMCNCYGIW